MTDVDATVKPAPTRRLRVAAYAVCIRHDRILLARYVVPTGDHRYWTLPGGGVEHAEDPYDAVIREVAEETGYQVDIDRLLGVDSRAVAWRPPDNVVQHNIGIFYRVSITGGRLRHEIDGTTDLAAWVPIAELAEQERAAVVDIGMKLDDVEPAAGHIDPVPVAGLLRHTEPPIEEH